LLPAHAPNSGCAVVGKRSRAKKKPPTYDSEFGSVISFTSRV
jgi:hypothetical protein